ncbi:MAG: hypothetical protein WBB46_04810 [Candidatus Deferrimicrobiaceae bacterium]
MRKEKVLFVAMALLLTLGTAYGQDSPSGPDAWHFEITPYFWAPGLDGDLTVAEVTVSPDVSFTDLFNNFDAWGFSTRVVARKGKWGIIFDFATVSLKTSDVTLEAPTGPVSAGLDIDIHDTQVILGVSYRAVETVFAGKTLWIEPMAGGRYHYFKEKLHLSVNVPGVGGPGANLGGSNDWVEPIVGMRMGLSLTEKTTFLLRGDIGGFGIGSASDLEWNLLAGFDYRFSQLASLKLGYLLQGVDYETGSGAGNFGEDATYHGPIVGVTFHY